MNEHTRFWEKAFKCESDNFIGFIDKQRRYTIRRPIVVFVSFQITYQKGRVSHHLLNKNLMREWSSVPCVEDKRTNKVVYVMHRLHFQRFCYIIYIDWPTCYTLNFLSFSHSSCMWVYANEYYNKYRNLPSHCSVLMLLLEPYSLYNSHEHFLRAISVIHILSIINDHLLYYRTFLALTCFFTTKYYLNEESLAHEMSYKSSRFRSSRI